MKFTKMHGCGNDYVYVNLFEETITDPEKLAIAVSGGWSCNIGTCRYGRADSHTSGDSGES